MWKIVRKSLLVVIFACSANAVANDGLAITSSEVTSALDANGFSLSNLILGSSQEPPLNNLELSQLELFKPILESLKLELSSLKSPRKDIRFDQDFFQSRKAGFILVGVINRMDRGYYNASRFGEIRFIYRMKYDLVDNGKIVRSKLPITVNAIFDAGLNKSSEHCAQLAERWLETKNSSTVHDLTTLGPLSPQYFSYQNLRSLEFNIQGVREGSENQENFGGRAQYLLKVYDWVGNQFEEVPLENQIDRARLVKDPALLDELKNWILKNLNLVDAGTLVVPKKFLSHRAISIAPGGLVRSTNRPYFDLFKPEDFHGVSFEKFEQIKSYNGLIRRLNDTTCTGCHQTRAIGGFHFSGMDPMKKYPGNSVFLPGSPHFMGDQPRRFEILNAVAKGDDHIDYSRGFAARPQARRSQVLQGSGLLDGWSAPCAVKDDASFNSWTCAAGFVCKPTFKTSKHTREEDSILGTCLNPVQKIGDPCEFGTATTKSYGLDQFTRTNDREIVDLNPKTTLCSPQSQDKGTKTGGFWGGNLRSLSCFEDAGGLPPEASCGPLPASKPGFNACIGKKNFDDCLEEFSIGVGLRGCDSLNPCRDDYIWTEGTEPHRGVCAPPYFLFQFRVDGHPRAAGK
ncbi:MAG: hypothetical protein KDD22_01250 [Bdellovibrionales bacterium]|nr:hypothetical protein [Bdellovibrionales bacterium]